MNTNYLENLIEDLDKILVVYGYNFPVVKRSAGNSEYSSVDICFIANNVKDLPGGIGVYSAGYNYMMKTVITIGSLVNNLRLALDNGYNLVQNHITAETFEDHIVIYGNISLQKDCKSKE